MSDRVPFGTGKAVNELLSSKEDHTVYNPQSFEDLKIFFEQVDRIWSNKEIEIPKTIQSFLGINWQSKLDDIRTKTASFDTFEIRFFKWFDAFKILKFVHYTRDRFYPNVPLEEALGWLSKWVIPIEDFGEKALLALRKYDQEIKSDKF